MSHRPRPLTSFLIEDILSTDESSRLNRSSLWTQKTDTGPQWDKYPGEVSKQHFQQSYLGVRKGNWVHFVDVVQCAMSIERCAMSSERCAVSRQRWAVCSDRWLMRPLVYRRAMSRVRRPRGGQPLHRHGETEALPRGVFASTSPWTWEEIQPPEIPFSPGEGSPGHMPETHRDPGEDLVPEPEIQD